MNEGHLNRLLQEQNAWWRNRGKEWQQDDRDLQRAKQAPFSYKPEVLSNIEPDGLYVLRGPRRVGKSVELKRTIARLIVQQEISPRRIIHFACDGLTPSDLRKLVTVGRELSTQGVEDPRYWFLDEVTGVKGDWAQEIKWLRDNTKFGEDCVVITGSSAARMLEATKALAGRRGIANNSERLLLPMGFVQFCAAVGINNLPDFVPINARELLSTEAKSALIELQPWLNQLTNAWELYLTVGGFPQAVTDHCLHGEVGGAIVDALWDVVVGDGIRSGNFTVPQTQSLLGRLATNLTQPISLSRLANDVGVGSHHTAKARIDDLIDAYLVWPCFRSSNGLPQLKAMYKTYFTDPLLASLGYLRNSLTFNPDISHLSEQQLGIELLRQHERDNAGTYSDFGAIMFMRTASNKEIDFVGPWLEPVALEGKYVDTNWRQEAMTMKAQFGGGILATRGILDFTDPVKAIPAPLIAWVLGS